MRKAWFYADPESGLVRDELGGTYVYEDTGKTLAQEDAEKEYGGRYFQVPMYVAWAYHFTEFFHNLVHRYMNRYYHPKY